MAQPFLSGIHLPWPVSWQNVFSRAAPLVAEIGFGGGDFLLAMARSQPELNLVGVEISLPSLRKVAHKLRRARLPQVRLLQSSARLFLWGLCGPGTLAGLHVNFPDPWPKAAHQHRRLLSGDFLALAASRLHPGAALEVATDDAGYAAAVAGLLTADPCFDSRLPAPMVTTDCRPARTKYEARALAEGRPCHYLRWRRNDAPAPRRFPIPREYCMPHVVLRTPLTLADAGGRFRPWRVTAAGAEIKLIECFCSTRDGKLLLDVYIHEPPVSQRVGVAVRPRRDGTWVVGLHEGGFPRPTAGVHAAVGAVADWLQQLDARTVVVNSTLQSGPQSGPLCGLQPVDTPPAGGPAAV